MSATENLAGSIELDVGIGDDGPFPAVVTTRTDHPYGMVADGRGIPTWNGWIAEPRFDRPTVERIAAMLDRDRAAGFESDRIVWTDSADGGMDTAWLSRPTEPDWPGEHIEPDADGRYAIGAYGWCWYEWDEGTIRE